MINYFCGIGESEILENEIKITKYPFEPSIVYPEKTLPAKDIKAICYSHPITLKVENEFIFISREQLEAIQIFVANHNIPIIEQNWNWSWLLEPYLDTEYTAEDDEKITNLLIENGFSKQEISKIRNEVEQQMYKYNSILWEWIDLNLLNVLQAMRVKYNKTKFRDFYQRAMQIEAKGFKNLNPYVYCFNALA
jgi:hypothetical protein